MSNTWSNVNPLYGNMAYTMAGSGGAVGTSGQVLTTTGMNGTSWSNVVFSNPNQKTLLTIPQGEDKVILEEKATLEVKGNVVINGIDLEERLKTIERVLAIPERDAIMEAKYPSLKKKFDEYINALEKYKTFERIKGDYE